MGDTVDTVERDPLSHITDMGDTVDTVERDPLSHITDMVDTVDTEDTDMAVVMATDMAVNSYLQEAKRFYYLIFQNWQLIRISQISIISTKHFLFKIFSVIY